MINGNISLEDMQGCIQEWFAQCLDSEDLRETYYVVRSEVDKQFDFCVESFKEEV